MPTSVPGELPQIFWIVLVVTLVIAVIVVASSVGLLFHHGVASRRRILRLRRVAEAAAALAPRLVYGEDLLPAARKAGRRWSKGAVGEVLRRARNDLQGSAMLAISEALVALGETQRLVRQVGSRKVWKRVAAARFLGESGGEEAVAALRVASKDRDPEVRRVVREALIQSRDAEAIGEAIQLHIEDQPLGMAWERSFFARLAAADRLRLRELVGSGDLDAHQEKAAIDALAGQRDEKALPLALERLGSEDPELRAGAVHLVGKLRSSSSLALLLPCLEDEVWFVRAATSRALSRIPCDRAAVAALGRSLGDEHWWVRSNSARALSYQGLLGKKKLIEILGGEDRYARHAAMWALANVEMTSEELALVEEYLRAWETDEVLEDDVSLFHARLARESE